MPLSLTDEVRSHCAGVAASATAVRIDPEGLERAAAGWTVDAPGLDDRQHLLEGSDEQIARATLIADTINFGSGWFPTLRKRVDPASGRPLSGTVTIAMALTEHHRAHGVWTADQLRTVRADALAAVLGQRPDHELMSLYAQALRSLGAFLGRRDALDLVADAEAPP